MRLLLTILFLLTGCAPAPAPANDLMNLWSPFGPLDPWSPFGPNNILRFILMEPCCPPHL